MNFQEMTQEEIQEISMVEIAFEVMKEKREPFDYYDLVEEVAAIKGMSKEEVEARIANLYTDMNIDGRFHSLGDNRWGLKSWYALEQAEEEITTPVKPRKKAKDLDDDIDLEEDFDDYEDEYEDLEDELDEISNDEDSDDDDFEDKEDLEDLDSEDDDLDDDFEEDEELN